MKHADARGRGADSAGGADRPQTDRAGSEGLDLAINLKAEGTISGFAGLGADNPLLILADVHEFTSIAALEQPHWQ